MSDMKKPSGNKAWTIAGVVGALAVIVLAAAGLPPDYAEALASGWWPSEDVLPPGLRRAARP